MENGNFGDAVCELKAGRKVWRQGWNGKGMWLVLVHGTNGVIPTPGSPYAKVGLLEVNICSHIDMFTAAGEMQPGWNPSQSDILAEDWCSDRVY